MAASFHCPSLHGSFTSKADSLRQPLSTVASLYDGFNSKAALPPRQTDTLCGGFTSKAAFPFLQSGLTSNAALSPTQPLSKAALPGRTRSLTGSLPPRHPLSLAASLFGSLQLRRIYPMADPWGGSLSFCQLHLPKQLCLPRQSFSKRARWNSMLNGTLTQDMSPTCLAIIQGGSPGRQFSAKTSLLQAYQWKTHPRMSSSASTKYTSISCMTDGYLNRNSSLSNGLLNACVGNWSILQEDFPEPASSAFSPTSMKSRNLINTTALNLLKHSSAKMLQILPQVSQKTRTYANRTLICSRTSRQTCSRPYSWILRANGNLPQENEPQPALKFVPKSKDNRYLTLITSILLTLASTWPNFNPLAL